MLPPPLTPLVSPTQQTQATYFHFDGLPHFPIPTPSPLTRRLSQSLSRASECFPSSNSAISLLTQESFPSKSFKPLLCNPRHHSQLPTVQQETPGLPSPLSPTCRSTFLFRSLLVPSFLLRPNYLWFYTWITSSKRQSLSSLYTAYSTELNGWWACTSRVSDRVPHFPWVYPATQEADPPTLKTTAYSEPFVNG